MLTRLIPDARIRSAAVAAAAFVLLLLTTQGYLHTPGAVLFSALVLGLLNALTAVGLVLIYRSNRVINFAQTAIGAAGGELTFQLLLLTDVPFFLAFPAGLVVAAGVGLVFDLCIGRRFANSPRLVLTVMTIAVAGVLSGSVRDLVTRLPFFPQNRSIEELMGTATLREEMPFRSFSFRVGDLNIPFGFPELFALVTSVVAIAGVGLYLRYGRSGVAIRAFAQNTERAALLGISTGTLTSIVWTLAGFLSGVGIILTGLLTTPSAATGVAPQILLPALAAAVLARMSSIPLAVAAAVGLQLLSSAYVWKFRNDAPIVSVALFVIVGLGLLVQRKSILRSEESGGVTWEATQEQRAIPRELARLTGVRVARYGLIAVGLLVLLLYPFVLSTGPLVLGGVIALTGILALSVLVLTGWAGQVSLGQFGFAAVGAVAGGALSANAGISFWLAVPLATLFTAAFAVLVGVPALRIKGLFLAVSTFAFAIAISTVLFAPRYFDWLLPAEVNRPTAFLIDFEDERAMYFLCVACLVLAITVVVNLRRSRVGRLLIAVRDNDANLQTFGVSAVRMKLLAFGISGALAGFSGAVFAHLQRGVSAASFEPQRSVDLFLLCVLGGVGSIPGVLMGTTYFSVTSYFLTDSIIFSVLQPFAVIMILFIEPTGLIGVVNRVRDGILRIVAQRRQLIVPSLFADIDPDDLARQLIPLAEPAPNAGLGTLGDRRFALASELYVGRGRPFLAERTAAKPSKEAALISAAGEAAMATGQES